MNLLIYCEWLDSELARCSLPKARFLMKVKVPGYRLVSTSFSEDNSQVVLEGCCHLVEAAEHLFLGVLYEVSEEELGRLDKLTRGEKGRYTRKYLGVIDEEGKKYDAVAHRIKNPKGKSRPSPEYLEHMIKGAREFI
jgi:gamma-glutamylcyclotransferase (GGCT)/AIG2-like uncharacterized protein YtfP